MSLLYFASLKAFNESQEAGAGVTEFPQESSFKHIFTLVKPLTDNSLGQPCVCVTLQYRTLTPHSPQLT